jgi:hypothetical protein
VQAGLNDLKKAMHLVQAELNDSQKVMNKPIGISIENPNSVPMITTMALFCQRGSFGGSRNCFHPWQKSFSVLVLAVVRIVGCGQGKLACPSTPLYVACLQSGFCRRTRRHQKRLHRLLRFFMVLP